MTTIAEIRDGEQKKEIAVGRLIMETSRKRGESAIVVEDGYQGLDLGTKIMDMLIEIAVDKGLEGIYGIILPENRKMVRLAQKMGFTIKPSAEGLVATLNLV